MKYYFLSEGNEYGIDIPSIINPNLQEVEEMYDKEDEDDHFILVIFEIDTETLKIKELKSKGYSYHE